MATRLARRLDAIEATGDVRDQLAFAKWWQRFLAATPEANRLALKILRHLKAHGIDPHDPYAMTQLCEIDSSAKAYHERFSALAEAFEEWSGFRR